jgi:hypothetical protein
LNRKRVSLVAEKKRVSLVAEKIDLRARFVYGLAMLQFAKLAEAT